MQKYINDFKNHGYDFIKQIDDLQNNELVDIIDKDGYKYRTYYNAIYKTWNPKKWGQNNPYSIDNLKKYIKLNGFKCEIISNEYHWGKIDCKCSCGNIYSLSIGNFLSKKIDTCPSCSAKRGGRLNIDKKYFKFIKNNNLELYQEEYKGCRYKTYFKTEDGYIVCGTLYNAINKSGISGLEYSKFNQYNKYFLYNVNHYIEIESNGKSKTRAIKVTKAKDKGLFVCGICGNEYETNVQHLILNKTFNCRECSLKRKANRIAQSFIYEDSEYNKCGLTLLEPYVNRTTEILCETKEGYLTYESECGLVSKRYKYLSKIFHKCNPYVINNIKTFIKNNNIDIELITNTYTDNKTKLTFKCSCGNLFKIPLIELLKGRTKCSNCMNFINSKLELKTSEFLNKYNIDFITQHTFDECRDKQKLPFDFYLPKYNTCIECQGIQHFEAVDYFGGEERFEYTQKHDNIKREYCENNKIELIYINYTDNDDNIEDIIHQIALRA